MWHRLSFGKRARAYEPTNRRYFDNASWADRRQAYFRPRWPESNSRRPARSLNAAYHRTRRPRCPSIGGCAQARPASRLAAARAMPRRALRSSQEREISPGPKGGGDRACGRSQRRLPPRGTSTSAESPSPRRASPRCWRRNVRRAPDDKRQDVVLRRGGRQHDRRWLRRAS